MFLTKFAQKSYFMVVTYYIKLFCTGTDRPNGIIMPILFLVPETIIQWRNTILI